MESISSNIAKVFYSKSTQMALEGHSKGTWALKALGYLSTVDTRALEGHLGPWTLKAFRHLGT